MDLFWLMVLIHAASGLLFFEAFDVAGRFAEARKSKVPVRELFKGYWAGQEMGYLIWAVIWATGWGVFDFLTGETDWGYAWCLLGFFYAGLAIWKWWNTRGKSKLAAKYAGYKHRARMLKMGAALNAS